MVRDPEFAMIRLRAYGTYEIRIFDPARFLKEIVGTDGHFTTDEIEDQLTNLIVSKLATVLGEDSTPVLDMARNYEKFGSYITEHIAPFFEEYGLRLTKMLIENISLPDEVEKAIDARSSREITGDLDANLKYQTGNALGNASGGSMGDMIGMGAGIAMGQQMAQNMNTSATATPPPLPNQVAQYYVAIDGKQSGPYSLAQIQTSITNGEITPETLVWTQGMAQWDKASSVLSTYFSQTPPPLPPQ